MGFNSIALGILLIAGLVVAGFGINIYRYAVIIMSAAGGFALGQIICENFLNGKVGEGVLRETNAGAIDSFVMAVCILGFAALGYGVYQIMGTLVAAVGGAFLFMRLSQALMGMDMVSTMIGVVTGLVIGSLISMLAIKYERFPLILFTALAGGRIAGFAGAFFLSSMEFGPAIAKPFLGLYSARFPSDAVEMSIALELFLVISVIGIVVQLILRDD